LSLQCVFQSHKERVLALAIAWVRGRVREAMASAKCAGRPEENLFKNAKGRPFFCPICPTFINQKSRGCFILLFVQRFNFQSPSCHWGRLFVTVGNRC